MSQKQGHMAALMGQMKLKKDKQLQSTEAEHCWAGQGRTLMRQQWGGKQMSAKGSLSPTGRAGALIRTKEDNSPAGRHWRHRPIPQRW